MNCLDAETLAAWMDGGLKDAALDDVQAHVAGCERCQMLLGAMGRTRAAIPAAEPQHASRRWLAWSVPLTAAAAAIAIWVAVPQQREVPAPQSTAASPSTEVPAAPPATPAEPARPPAAAAPAPKAERSDDIVQLAPDAAIVESVPPPVAPAPEPRAEQRGIVAGQVQERAASVARDAVASCGPAPPPEAVGQLTASSASAGVCWTVGRAGFVFRSTDGRTWQRVNFPEMTDLVAVRATDGQTVSVTTADGRMFSTANGGQSWTVK